MRYLFLFLVFVIVGCDSRKTDADNFRIYSENWFKSAGLATTKFDCSMIGHTRAGYCLFKWPKANFPLLEDKLGLIPIEGAELKNAVFMGGVSKGPCGSLETFSGLSNKTWENYSNKVYNSNKKPGPIFKGNVSSSFDRFWYSPEKEIGCLSLQYPYG